MKTLTTAQLTMLNKKTTAVTLLSGGLDSTVATYMAQETCDICLALTFDYGQRAAKAEINAAKITAEKLNIKHRVINLDWLKDISDSALLNMAQNLPKPLQTRLDTDSLENAKAVWVPNRNGLFVAVAAAFAEGLSCEYIIAGFNKEEAQSFPDNSQDFINASNKAFEFSTLKRVKLISPTSDLSKAQVAQKFIEFKIDPASIWSCYDGNLTPCNKCESCLRLIRAFENTSNLLHHCEEAGPTKQSP